MTAVQPSGPSVCVGDQAQPEVVCLGHSQERTELRWSSEPGSPTAQEVTTWRDTTKSLFDGKLSEPQIVEMLAQVTVPTTRPHFSGLTIDRLGNVWVELDRGNKAALESVDNLVFDQAGALLGVVALPPIRVLEIGADYVLGVFRDRFDVEYVQLHAVVKPADR